MDYLLSEPIPLPENLTEKKNALLPYAEHIAYWYGDPFDPTNPERQLTTALHANYLIEARREDELVGIFAFGVVSPEKEEDKPFFDNLDLDKLPADLYPVPLEEIGRERVKKAIEEIKTEFDIVEIQEQVAHADYRGNGISSAFKEAAFASLTHKEKVEFLTPRKRLLLGDIGSGSSIISRTKKEIGGVTYYGGLVLEPDRAIPFGLTSDEFKVLGQVLAYAYAQKHYPGVQMDRNGILDSEVWDKLTKMPDFKFAVNNPDPARNNLAVPQIKEALQKLIDYQLQNPGHFYSGIAVTIVENPNQNIISMPNQPPSKAA